jgi:hypothetical protein
MKRAGAWLVAAGVLSAFALVAPVIAKSGNKYGDTVRAAACGDDGSMTVSIEGPEKLWPPNHKLVDVVLTATDSDGDEVMLASEGTHDQYAEDGTEENGAGNTAVDVDPPAATGSGPGSATTAHGVRAERAGPDQEGRTYTITYEAEGGLDDTCMGSFDIFVPHDMRGGRDW